jgi:hypothetical protein
MAVLERFLWIAWILFSLTNGVLWGTLYYRHPSGSPPPWKSMLKSFLLILIAYWIAVTLFLLMLLTFGTLSVGWGRGWIRFLLLLFVLVVTGLLLLAYHLSHPRKIFSSEAPPALPVVAPSGSYPPKPPPALSPFGQGLFTAIAVPLFFSFLFGLGAYLVLTHGPEAQYYRGRVPLGLLFQILLLIGLQIATSLGCFTGTATLTALFSSNRVRPTGKIINPLLFGILSVMINLLIDIGALVALVKFVGIFRY